MDILDGLDIVSGQLQAQESFRVFVEPQVHAECLQTRYLEQRIHIVEYAFS